MHRFPVPPAPTVFWDRTAWDRWIRERGEVCAPPAEVEALGRTWRLVPGVFDATGHPVYEVVP